MASNLSSPAAGSTTSSGRTAIGSIGRSYGGLAALLLLIAYNAVFNAGAFLTVSSLRINLTQVAEIAIVATAMTLVIATGGIDLSVGSLMAIAGSIAPLILLSSAAPWDVPFLGGALAYVIPILVVAAFGAANGFLVASLRIQPIIATLILFISGRGIAQVIAGGRLKSFDEPGWQVIGQGRVLGIPVQAIIMVVVVVTAAWVLKRTVFGRYVLATGGNEEAARLAGVPVVRVKYAVYIVSAMLAGLAGLISIAINSASDPANVGQDMELNAIAAVAVGGTSLLGGRATIVGTFIGALIIQLTGYTLLTEGLSDATVRIVTAGAILGAVLLQRRAR
ncbi:MAG: Ribose ABC transport system, permease protein RbsC [uncultured Thermomicrobiales bacterium]|uniref:Ribose ABC transport system, permease protein RbsC n=1 Tax=uncultured Thermomicrobiales bacterium TaxID=1645740 RepID=A0A6J4UT29_9BACT|nr:MAG: Ribose ABC transport system, permease protein RbsC [uncultured Thermomicrobiales bacterium]